jgi:asparagine synthetase B (glutamine-hydrolysing)
VYLARDPVGCNKLFFGLNGAGHLVVANRVVKVWQSGVPLSSVASCPPGHLLEVSGGTIQKISATNLYDIQSDPELNSADFHTSVRAALDKAFAWLRQEFTNCHFVVCLSGGLDSSVIATFAAAHLPGVTAATFTYLDDDDLRRLALGGPLEHLASVSRDARSAVRVAASLEMPLLPVVRPRQAVAAAVRASVQLGQDWRDFNVHCATVNLFLAQDLRAAFPGQTIVALTGDLMNEYVADYAEEHVGEAVYYRVPRIPAAQRRKHFVRGLDAGDREIGVFNGYGLIACQPFAVLAERYMRVPGPLLESPEAKWGLNGPLLAPQAAPHVSRSKTRAQVAGDDQGTLGLYHRLGIGTTELRRLWQEQFPGEPAAACDDFIQFGRYRAPCYMAGQ